MPESQDAKVVELISAIDSKLAKVHTQSLDLSFNELFDMYKSERRSSTSTPTTSVYSSGRKGLSHDLSSPFYSKCLFRQFM
jgi:hypothetical protein